MKAKLTVDYEYRGTEHVVVKIHKRGRVYACTWAKPFPTKSEALQAYKDYPGAFRPFDETYGRYL